MEEEESHQRLKLDHTKSTKDQVEIENVIREIFDTYKFNVKDSESYKDSDMDPIFLSSMHFEFAYKMKSKLPTPYESLDSGMPWFAYWVMNILNMCEKNNFTLSDDIKRSFVRYLKELWHPEGGFCGYAKGIPHVISNYAAVMAIIAIGLEEGYELIDIPKMKNFLLKLKNNTFKDTTNPTHTTRYDKNGNFLINYKDKDNINSYQSSWPGSFQVHECGESDLRAAYCAIIVANILCLPDEEIYRGVAENISLCQSFEGGLGPEPYCEAHGGYSFCGIATLCLMNRLDVIDTDRFVQWLVSRQMSVEGGFQGRANKLVDSCYSFWQGSVFNMLMNADPSKFTINSEMLYDQYALQAYILLACQSNSKGGLIDKPGKNPDLFHTNYATAGLILSQESLIKDLSISISYDDTLDFEGSKMDPIFCVNKSLVEKARLYFYQKSQTNTK